jgi:selenium metabolism protein YedF
MAQTVDARGLACPQPVILTRKAMQEASQVVTLVDNETSMTNVSRMARRAGWQVDVVAQGDEYRIEMAQDGPLPEADPLSLGTAQAVTGPLVLVISSEVMGHGEQELGSILIRSFFHTLGEVQPTPNRIVFFNTGVKLACEGSPVLDDLCALEADGVEILVCGTCLDYFELTEEIGAGQVSNMYDIAETMLGAGRLVQI